MAQANGNSTNHFPTAEEYAPYNAMPEFWQGYQDYHSCIQRHVYDGVKGQAYDRGAEFAMRLCRGQD
jgi:hypothetical protein